MKTEDGSGDAPQIKKDAPSTTDSNPPAGQLLCCYLKGAESSNVFTMFIKLWLNLTNEFVHI